ncbi:MAG: hypothetical protein JEZ09_17525 [Salinivirgaceae bacterium]|nr:hypothetical protein [Salinivirgaceae bacterium]
MMTFPFYYTGEIIFYKPENFENTDFQKHFESGNLKIKTLLNFPASVTFIINDENVSIQVLYKISMFEQNIILLFSFLMATFFYLFDANALSIISIFIGVFYYIGNLSKVSKSIKNLVYSYIGGNLSVEESTLWNLQQKWMKDKNLCPACGEPKNPYSNKCINCGIYLSKKTVKLESENSTTVKDIVIDYKIKK